METLMHEPIRIVLERYPAIGGLLVDNGVDIQACLKENCLLRDVVKRNRLTPEQEHRLMAEIRNLLSHAVHADVLPSPFGQAMPLGSFGETATFRDAGLPVTVREGVEQTGPASAPAVARGTSGLAASMPANEAGRGPSPDDTVPTETLADNAFAFPSDADIGGADLPSLAEPLRELITEHERITRLLGLIPGLLARNDLRGTDRPLADDLIRYARAYTDRFHHMKEEEILFRLPQGAHPFLQAMIAEHATGRDLLRQAEEGLRSGEVEQLESSLSAYLDLQRDHMRRESSILYPWFSRTLTEEQLAEITERFDLLDTREGSSLEGEVDAFIESSEKALLVVKPVIHAFSSMREKTVERLVRNADVAISHMILPAGEAIEGHRANTHVYFIITHGMVTVRHSDTQEEKYVQGTVVHLPPDTWMELRNEGPGTFEMFVVRAPNP